MWDFSIGRALGLVARTWPFLLLKLAVYFGATLAYILAALIGAGLGWGIGALGSDDFRAGATIVGGLIGFGIVGAVLYFAREYILYLVKGAHVAVLVELLDGRPLPQEFNSQIQYGQRIVRERFLEASILFGVDQLIKGVIRAITGLVRTVFSILPFQGARQLMNVVETFLKIGVGLVDEVILAHGIRTRATNPWASARTALVLYGQNYKTMLKNAAWLTLFTYGLALIAFILLLGPAAGIAYLFPGTLAFIGVVIAIFLAWSVKAAVVDPFAMTAMMDLYFRTIEGQVPDPEWEAKLDGLSKKFGELGRRAMSYTPPMAGRAETARTGPSNAGTA
ncbi:MAG: hypothetical protein IT535_11870 [Bauldia sp.]|nr:hypothetical protein [Bauldia sp.]